jgi:hypothetical protein
MRSDALAESIAEISHICVIYVQGGRVIEVELPENASVKQLKKAIEDQEGPPC